MAIMRRAIRAIMTIFPNYGHNNHYGQINLAKNEACLNWQKPFSKSYGQDNVASAKMAIPFVFLARLGPQSDVPGAALPN